MKFERKILRNIKYDMRFSNAKREWELIIGGLILEYC